MPGILARYTVLGLIQRKPGPTRRSIIILPVQNPISSTYFYEILYPIHQAARHDGFRNEPVPGIRAPRPARGSGPGRSTLPGIQGRWLWPGGPTEVTYGTTVARLIDRMSQV